MAGSTPQPTSQTDEVVLDPAAARLYFRWKSALDSGAPDQDEKLKAFVGVLDKNIALQFYNDNTLPPMSAVDAGGVSHDVVLNTNALGAITQAAANLAAKDKAIAERKATDAQRALAEEQVRAARAQRALAEEQVRAARGLNDMGDRRYGGNGQPPSESATDYAARVMREKRRASRSNLGGPDPDVVTNTAKPGSSGVTVGAPKPGDHVYGATEDGGDPHVPAGEPRKGAHKGILTTAPKDEHPKPSASVAQDNALGPPAGIQVAPP